MIKPQFLLIIFFVGKDQMEPENAGRKYISKKEYDLLSEEWTTKIEVCNKRYDIVSKKKANIPTTLDFTSLIIIEIKKNDSRKF